MSGDSSMGRGDRPTEADIEAMKLWTSLEGLGSRDDGAGVGTAHSDGRIILPGPTAEEAREAEEFVRAREKRHAEGQARLTRAVRGALGLSHSTALGSWASPSVRARISRVAEDHGGHGGHGGEGGGSG